MTVPDRKEAWGSDFEEPPRKSRIPILAWVLGSGCLFLVLLGVVVAIAFSRFLDHATDPDVQWPRIAEVLPFDERPPVIHRDEIVGGAWGDVQVWLMVTRDRRYQVLLMHVDGRSAEGTRQAFFRAEDEVFTLSAHGHELAAMRSGGDPPEIDDASPLRDVFLEQLASGPSLRVELTPTESSELLLLQWTDMETEDPVDEGIVIEFLGSFHLEELR